MRFIRHGLVFTTSFYLSLAFMVGCAHFHQVIFLNEACIKPYHEYEYRTCDPMRVTIDGKKYVVYKNFKTDLASIPRFLWPIFAPQYAGFVAPSILHDYLYRCHTRNSRQFSDEVLYSALLAEGVTTFTAAKFYMAVRLFGSSHFGKNNEDC